MSKSIEGSKAQVPTVYAEQAEAARIEAEQIERAEGSGVEVEKMEVTRDNEEMAELARGEAGKVDLTKMEAERVAHERSEVAKKYTDDLEAKMLQEALEEEEEHARRAPQPAKGRSVQLSESTEVSKSVFSHISLSAC